MQTNNWTKTVLPYWGSIQQEGSILLYFLKRSGSSFSLRCLLTDSKQSIIHYLCQLPVFLPYRDFPLLGPRTWCWGNSICFPRPAPVLATVQTFPLFSEKGEKEEVREEDRDCHHHQTRIPQGMQVIAQTYCKSRSNQKYNENSNPEQWPHCPKHN